MGFFCSLIFIKVTDIFEISEQSFPLNHPGLISSYYNIGVVYEEMTNYSKAYSSYERAVENA